MTLGTCVGVETYPLRVDVMQCSRLWYLNSPRRLAAGHATHVGPTSKNEEVTVMPNISTAPNTVAEKEESYCSWEALLLGAW